MSAKKWMKVTKLTRKKPNKGAVTPHSPWRVRHHPSRARRAHSTRRILAAGCFVLCNVTVMAIDVDRRSEALKAFRAGDYVSTTDQFTALIDGGAEVTPLDHFNLAVAHFKLDQFDLAEQHFLRASAEPKLKSIAYYNLGLVARAAGEDSIARSWFSETLVAEDETRLADLADRAIESMGPPPRPTQPRPPGTSSSPPPTGITARACRSSGPCSCPGTDGRCTVRPG